MSSTSSLLISFSILLILHPLPQLTCDRASQAFDDTHVFKIKWADGEQPADQIAEKIAGIPDPETLDVFQLNEDAEAKGQENIVWLKTRNQEVRSIVLSSIASV
jgi:hypothetical protein